MTPQRLLLVNVGVMAALLLAGSLFYVMPGFTQLSALKGDVSRLEAELSAPTRGADEVDTLRADLEELKQFGAERMTPIPESSNIAELVGQISAALVEVGVDRKEMTTGTPDELPEASVIPVSLEITSGFGMAMEALARVEALPRLVRISRLQLRQELRRSNPGANGPIHAHFMLDVFYAPRDIEDEEASS